MEKIIFVTLSNGYFGSAWNSWEALSIEKISCDLKKLNIKVYVSTIENILKDYDLVDGDIVIYTSSENPSIRQYVKDVMYYVDKKCQIIPSYDLLLSHENKGFQELYRKNKGIGDLEGDYFIDHQYLPNNYPFVYKTIDGSGSFGVELVNNSKQKNRLIENKEKDTYKRKAINFLRRLKLNNEEFDIYSYNKKKFSGFVIQDFIEGLEFDYKILVFWGKFYVLKRNIKKGDFRASGSGLFEFKEPSNAVLNYAKYIFETLDTPYASLDIAESYVGCKLIEYQALNFGPYALIKSPGYYTLNDGYWVFIEVTSSLEVEFSRSLAAYVSNM